MKFPHLSTTMLGPVVGALLFVPIVLTQIQYDNLAHPELIYKVSTNKHVLPENIVKHLTFGFNNALADYYWVSIIQDLAGWNRKDDFYFQEFKNLQAVDPRFGFPYLFAILTIPSNNRHDISGILQVEPFAKKGINALPDNWEIPYYLAVGFQFAGLPDKTLEYLDIAASRPGAPAAVTDAHKLYLQKKIKGDQASKTLIQVMYDSTNNKATKEIIRNNILITQAMEQLSKASQSYKEKFGRYPTSLDEVVDAKLIQIESSLRRRINVSFNPTTGQPLVTTKDTTDNKGR